MYQDTLSIHIIQMQNSRLAQKYKCITTALYPMDREQLRLSSTGAKNRKQRVVCVLGVRIRLYFYVDLEAAGQQLR